MKLKNFKTGNNIIIGTRIEKIIKIKHFIYLNLKKIKKNSFI